MIKINDKFSEQPAVVAELFSTLGVLQVMVMNEKVRNLQVQLNDFHLSAPLSFQKKSTTFNYY